MRILVTGSRDWKDRDVIHRDLSDLLTRAYLAGEQLVLVHGWCETGADAIADEWGMSRRNVTDEGVIVERYAADWLGSCRTTCKPGHRRFNARRGGSYCPLAGHYRNQLMVDRGADEVRAYQLNGSRGTQDCIDRARAAGLTVVLREAS